MLCQMGPRLLGLRLGLETGVGTPQHAQGGRRSMGSKSDMCQRAYAVGSPRPTQGSKDREAGYTSSSHTAAMERGVWRVVSGGEVVLWHNIVLGIFSVDLSCPDVLTTKMEGTCSVDEANASMTDATFSIR